MGSKNILGRKEDLQYILKKLTAEKIKPVSNTLLKQEFVEVPCVGEVTLQRLYADDVVRTVAEGVVYFDNFFNNKRVECNWFDALNLAERLGLELLSNKEYWQSVKWALENNEKFAKNLQEWTWTKTLVIWKTDFLDKEIQDLLEHHNYKGEFPLIIENPKTVVQQPPTKYKLEGGKLITPSQPLLTDDSRFEFSDLEENTGLPSTSTINGRFISDIDDFNFTAVACGYTEPVYQIFGTWCPDAKGVGMFCKKI